MVCTGGAYLKVCVFLGKINYELGKVFVVHRVVVVQLGANLKKVKFSGSEFSRKFSGSGSVRITFDISNM